MTHFPSTLQNFLNTELPLPVALSSYVFIVPSRSLISTFSASIRKLEATYDPEVLRQFAQWQRWPRRFAKSSESLIVTVMLPQRQDPLMPFANSEASWLLGSPVNSGMMESCGFLMQKLEQESTLMDRDAGRETYCREELLRKCFTCDVGFGILVRCGEL